MICTQNSTDENTLEVGQWSIDEPICQRKCDQFSSCALQTRYKSNHCPVKPLLNTYGSRESQSLLSDVC